MIITLVNVFFAATTFTMSALKDGELFLINENTFWKSTDEKILPVDKKISRLEIFSLDTEGLLKKGKTLLVDEKTLLVNKKTYDFFNSHDKYDFFLIQCDINMFSQSACSNFFNTYHEHIKKQYESITFTDSSKVDLGYYPHITGYDGTYSNFYQYYLAFRRLEKNYLDNIQHKIKTLGDKNVNGRATVDLYNSLQDNFDKKDHLVYLKEFFHGILSACITECLEKYEVTTTTHDILGESLPILEEMQQLYFSNFAFIKKKMNVLYLQNFLKKKNWNVFFKEQFLEMNELEKVIENNDRYNSKDNSSWDLLLDCDIPDIQTLVSSIEQYAFLLNWMKKNNIAFSFFQVEDKNIPRVIDLAHHKFKDYIFPWIEAEYKKHNLYSVLEHYASSYTCFKKISYATLKETLCHIELRGEYSDVSILLRYVEHMIQDLNYHYITAHYQNVWNWASNKNILSQSDIKNIQLTDKNKDNLLPVLIDTIKNNLMTKYEHFRSDQYVNQDILAQHIQHIGTISPDSPWQGAQQNLTKAINDYATLLRMNAYYAYILDSGILTEQKLDEMISLKKNFEQVITKVTEDLKTDISRIKKEKAYIKRFSTKENTILSFDSFQELCNAWQGRGNATNK
jgi:hypothetical protein